MAETYTGFSETYEVPHEAGLWLVETINSYDQTICETEWTHDGLLHLWCDKYLDIDMLAYLVQKMMLEFDIDSSLNIEWATWSTDPKEVGGFGGGFVIVTREVIYWADTKSLIEEYYE